MPEYTADQIRAMPAGRELDAAVEWLHKKRPASHLMPRWSTDMNLAITLMQEGWKLHKCDSGFDVLRDRPLVDEFIAASDGLDDPAVAICRARCILKLTEGE